MHPEVRSFVEMIRCLRPEFFRDQRVLEIGARNINGSVRELFHDCIFTGVDAVPGPNVDVVALAHDFAPDAQFGTVFSTETLEHDPYWELSLAAMARFTAPGGLFFGTCAGPGRKPHGGQGKAYAKVAGPGGNYYRNLSESDILGAIPAELFPTLTVGTIPRPAGTTWYGIRA
jgi:hypothetical protein